MKKSYPKLICDACTQYFWIHIVSKNVKKVDFSKLIKWTDPLKLYHTLIFCNYCIAAMSVKFETLQSCNGFRRLAPAIFVGNKSVVPFS